MRTLQGKWVENGGGVCRFGWSWYVRVERVGGGKGWYRGMSFDVGEVGRVDLVGLYQMKGVVYLVHPLFVIADDQE
jgi:hypothetical protein